MRQRAAIVLALVTLFSACGSRQTQATSPAGQRENLSVAQADVVQPGATPPAGAPATVPVPERSAQPSATPSAAVVQHSAEASYVPANTPAASQSAVSTSPTPQPGPRFMSIPAGTVFRVRLDETLDTRLNRAGDGFSATLVHPISEQGATAIPEGTRFHGHLTASKQSGRFKGRAVLGLNLDSFDLNGQRYSVATSGEARMSGGHKKRNWVLMGGGSGAGAAIGAVAAGPFGALVGAGAGGAAGTVGAAITGKKNVRLPTETLLAFSLRKPVPIEE